MINLVPAGFFNGTENPYMTVKDGLDLAAIRVAGIRFRTVCLPKTPAMKTLARWEPGFDISLADKERLLSSLAPLCERLMEPLSISPDPDFILYMDASVVDLSPEEMDDEAFELAYIDGAAAFWPADPLLPPWAARLSISQTMRHSGDWMGLAALLDRYRKNPLRMEARYRDAIAVLDESASLSRLLVRNFILDLEERYGQPRGDIEQALANTIDEEEFFFTTITDLLLQSVEGKLISEREAHAIIASQYEMIEAAINSPLGPEMDTNLICRLIAAREEYELLLDAPANWAPEDR